MCGSSTNSRELNKKASGDAEVCMKEHRWKTTLPGLGFQGLAPWRRQQEMTHTASVGVNSYDGEEVAQKKKSLVEK